MGRYYRSEMDVKIAESEGDRRYRERSRLVGLCRKLVLARPDLEERVGRYVELREVVEKEGKSLRVLFEEVVPRKFSFGRSEEKREKARLNTRRWRASRKVQKDEARVAGEEGFVSPVVETAVVETQEVETTHVYKKPKPSTNPSDIFKELEGVLNVSEGQTEES